MTNSSNASSATLLEVSNNSELLPLIKVRQRYSKARVCVGSKAALAVLFWSFAVTFAYILFLHKQTIATVILSQYSQVFIIIIISGYAAILQCFFPIAGYLADTKFGRYKTIHISLWILLLALLCTGIAGILYYFHGSSIVATGTIYAACLIYMIGLPGFNANVIQFGLDQLFDTPAEDQSLFIQWYVWAYYLSYVILILIIDSKILTNSHVISFTLFAVPLLIITTVLLISLYMFYRNRKWFLIITRYKNPYALVFKATKFSHLHKVPVNRSAFTYCEDEIPSGLDLGKVKYGGPFTTEQVEDVKAFYGVLKVIFSLGPVLFIHIAESHITSLLSSHVTNTTVFSEGLQSNMTPLSKSSILGNGTIYSLAAFMGIPLFIFLFRPLVRDHIPGMLKCIGLGILASILSLLTSLVIDVIIHAANDNVGCLFSMQSNYTATNESTSTSYTEHTGSLAKYLQILQQILSAISHTVFYIAVYEFICSQSPHSMKGLLLGIFYATRGLYEILGSLLMIPFALIQYEVDFPSCGMIYYIANILIGVVALMMYICTARHYKFRVRDEVCPVRRHVEEYYSNVKQEKFYDYD